MILVDTSVWIEFLKANEPVFSQLREQLEQQNVFGLECVFGELLQGAKNQKEKKALRNYWNNLPKMDESGLWIEAGDFSSQKKLFAKGVGLIDAFIVSASRKYQTPIWTLDKKLRSILKAEDIFSILS